MQLIKFIKLGRRHLTQRVTEELYLNWGYDTTKPLSIRGDVTNQCNYQCRYCNTWKNTKDSEEMSISQWQIALTSLKKWLGPYVIQFTGGGEPFTKKNLVDLLQFCHREGIQWGVCTNGSAFNFSNVETIVSAEPMNIDISVDSATAAIHDFVRGTPHSLDNITKGIKLLTAERDRRGLKFPIRIKPTVHSYNFRTLPELVDWATQVGATTIDFSPVRLAAQQQVKSELWIKPGELESLRQIVETLIRMKQEGAPIETSDDRLRSYPTHFLEQPINTGISPCRVGLRHYYIKSNGEVITCWFYPAIGNVKDQSAKSIWYSDKAKQIRAQTVKCTRFGSIDCANSCLARRSFIQEIKRALLFLRQ
ncbi:Fe-S oxidoreductase [Thioploca ingrica]|uniref:Fe-S oxidoreductase n=1 Tax=Thioploca ingrica TaxID=40754 RepID=A0A090ACR3_9GAMM|nr:Fe-S oxidoreductase [Thioploca ingrica]